MLQGRNVLVVEDEPLLGANLCAWLERRGWRTVLASTGAAAIGALTGLAPAVILLDYQLPDMDGFEVLGALAQRPGRCGCVLMTAHPMDNMGDAVRQHGITHVLSKPFSMADMEQQLLAAMTDRAHDPAAALR